MTPEQKAAWVMAQAAMLNAEIAAMEADNLKSASNGEAVVYGAREFRGVIDKYEGTLGWNAVIGLFHDKVPL